MKPLAEQLVAQPIPLSGRRREEFLRFRAPLGENRLDAALVLRGGRCRTDLFANERPEPPGGRIEVVARHRVEIARAFGARRNPAGVGEGLQMPADRRLRELHDAAQLRHGQLVPVEQQQNAAARRIGERGEVIEDGRGLQSVNPD